MLENFLIYYNGLYHFVNALNGGMIYGLENKKKEQSLSPCSMNIQFQ